MPEYCSILKCFTALQNEVSGTQVAHWITGNAEIKASFFIGEVLFLTSFAGDGDAAEAVRVCWEG